MIDGYVKTGTDGRPVYQGNHDLLRQKYGALDLPALSREISGDQSGAGL